MSIKVLLTSSLLAFLLSSCGAKPADDTVASPETKISGQTSPTIPALANSIMLSTPEDLPVCDDVHKSQLAYIVSTKQFQVCDRGAWIVVDIKGEKGDRGEPGPFSSVAPIMPGDIIPPGSVTLNLFGKKLSLDNEMLEWSCNQYLIDFFVNAQSSCRGVSVNTSYNSGSSSTGWTIASADGAIGIAASELNEKLAFNGESYFCFQAMNTNLYTDNGAKVYSSVTFLSKTPAVRVADLVPANIVGIGGSSQNLCTAIDQ
jgi:hypothetical protein